MPVDSFTFKKSTHHDIHLLETRNVCLDDALAVHHTEVSTLVDTQLLQSTDRNSRNNLVKASFCRWL